MNGLKKIGLGFLLMVALSIPVTLLILMPWWVLLACIVGLAVWMALTQTGRQTAALAAVGIATLPHRLSASSVVVVGIAGVVGVLVALLAMAAGFEATLKQTGS